VLKSGQIRAWLVQDEHRMTLDSAIPTASAYAYDTQAARQASPDGKLGKRGLRLELKGAAPGNPLEKILSLEAYEDFPTLLIVKETYRNTGTAPIRIDHIVVQPHLLDASLAGHQGAAPALCSFTGASLEWGQNDVVGLTKGFARQNLMGTMLPGGMGGGIPVVAFWNVDMGVAIGHIEPEPLALSLPVKVNDDGRVATSVVLDQEVECAPGGSFETPRTFLTVYKGDFYEPLRIYSQILAREGRPIPKPSSEAYQMSWCGWGYEFDVTPAQMLGTIPKLKELGIHWATLDDRWFANYGDWEPRSDTFPRDSIKQMVKKFHQEGVLVQLWWLVLGVEPGEGAYGPHRFTASKVFREHADWLILDSTGRPAHMSRNLAALCPALPEVQEYYRQLTTKFIKEWDFDGHKLDVAFSVPPCFNPKHHHKSPDESTRALGKVFDTIFNTTRSLKRQSVTQICPCGTPPNLAFLAAMDQAVTADPVGAVQVRQRIKMYKALLGPQAAVYGDHVELSEMKREGREWIEIGQDFASTVGTGGVPGTKFTYPDYGPKFKRVFLTPEKEAHWKKWTSLYNSMMLSQGEFLNLYTIGYSVPEAYAIRKGQAIYYAFFASGWEGGVDLRGLSPGVRYHLRDYENDRPLGEVTGPDARIMANFKDHLLIEAKP
jgi:alpha-galactosidase